MCIRAVFSKLEQHVNFLNLGKHITLNNVNLDPNITLNNTTLNNINYENQVRYQQQQHSEISAKLVQLN